MTSAETSEPKIETENANVDDVLKSSLVVSDVLPAAVIAASEGLKSTSEEEAESMSEDAHQSDHKADSESHPQTSEMISESDQIRKGFFIILNLDVNLGL